MEQLSGLWIYDREAWCYPHTQVEIPRVKRGIIQNMNEREKKEIYNICIKDLCISVDVCHSFEARLYVGKVTHVCACL